jgi:uncharacterized protein
VTDPAPAHPAGTTLRTAHAAAARLRQCAVTRTEKSVDEMIRFVIGPDGAIAPDLARKLPGRGVWVTATRAAVAQAVARNAFSKSLKQPTKPDAALPDLVEQMLLVRLRQALSFANKAGLVTTGFTKVEAAIEAGQGIGLIQAHDAADDGVDRLQRKYRAIAEARGRKALFTRHFGIDELSMALGRSNVVHAILTEGGQSRAFLRDSLRLEQFRQNDETSSAPVPDTQSAAHSGLSTDTV